MQQIKIRKILLALGDIFLLYFSFGIMMIIGFGANLDKTILFQHFWAFSTIYLIWLIIFYIVGLYDLNLTPNNPNFYSLFSVGLGLAFAAGIIFFYLGGALSSNLIAPKTNLIINTLFFGLLAISWRFVFFKLFSYRFQRRVAIIGFNKPAKEIAQTILEHPYLGYKFVSFISNIKKAYRHNADSPLSPVQNATIVNLDKNFLINIKKQNIDTLIAAVNLYLKPKLANYLYRCISDNVNVLSLSQAYETIVQKIPISFLSQAWFIDNIKTGKRTIYDKIKRIIDVIFASLMLILGAPLLALIALSIKVEDGGPVFYRQTRIGKNKKPFVLVKFRSMQKEAETKGPKWAEQNDPRITKVGKFLRRTHLDELPQMINVLKGEISLVGPRPERPQFVQQLAKEIPYYHIRHLIKPGFTGWAQLKFRYARTIGDSQKKLEYDLYYLKNRSLSLDLTILLKTFQLLFRKE